MKKVYKATIILIAIMLVSSLTAYANIVTGTVTLPNFSDSTLGITGTAAITDGTNTETIDIVLDGSGNYSFTTSLSGCCAVIIKCSHWLAQTVYGANVTSGSINIGTVSLMKNGDVVENNEVDFSDINAVRAAYGSFPGDETWNEMADVDGSGEVDFTDINIVRSNYGEIGEVAGGITEMIYIPDGSFLMGNSGIGYDAIYDYIYEELPQHSVTLSGYHIGKYEVTRGEYRQFMNAGGYLDSSYWSSAGWIWNVGNNNTEPYYWAESQDWGTGTFSQTDNHPVIGVSYYEAEAFCSWAGGHLPTEAQWERAARWNASTSHPNVFPWGDTWNNEYSNNYYDNNPAGGGYTRYQTAPVGSYLNYPSPSGCLDMAGNVWEWCQDWYKSYPGSTSPFDYTNTYRVLRGGGWDDPDGNNRCAYRSIASPYYYYSNYGFRLAR